MLNDNYFYAKIDDMIRREQKGEGMVFSSFLTAEESIEAERYCLKNKVPYFLSGGYDQSERKILAVSSYDEDILKNCMPISLLMIQGKETQSLTHKDVLGGLMAQGIRRDQIGDIIVRDGLALFFAMDQIREYLIQNVTSLGRCSVSLAEAPWDFQIPEPKFEQQRVTVASLRIDAVVSGLGHCSRSQAEQLIAAGLVFLNHIPVEKKTKEISAGDNLVIRGKGKWIIDECGAETKKGRIIIICRKYI